MKLVVDRIDNGHRSGLRHPAGRPAVLIRLDYRGAAQTTEHQCRTIFQHFDDDAALAGADDLAADAGAQAFDSDGQCDHCVKTEPGNRCPEHHGFCRLRQPAIMCA